MQFELDVDEGLLASAAIVLGTMTKTETINGALAVIASGSARHELLAEIKAVMERLTQRYETVPAGLSES